MITCINWVYTILIIKESRVESLRDTLAYKDDWLGLKTLDEAKKLKHLTFDGDHLRVPAGTGLLSFG